MPLGPVRGVFFDLYRTLLVVDDATRLRHDWLTALCQALEGLGRETSFEILAGEFSGFFARPEPPAADDGLSVLERRLGRLCGDLGLRVANAELPVLSAAVVGVWGRHFSLDAEAPAMLEVLGRRFALALISNFDHPAHVHEMLAETGLGRHFASVTISGEIGVRKPDPAIFRPALAATGLAPGDAVYVGDSPEDVAGARAAGIRPVRIDRQGDLAEADDVVTIRRLSELPGRLG